MSAGRSYNVSRFDTDDVLLGAIRHVAKLGSVDPGRHRRER